MRVRQRPQLESRVRVVTGAGTVRIVVHGDMTRSDHVAEFYGLCCANLSHVVEQLFVDMRGVEQSDSKLIATLIAVAQQARQRKARLHVELSPPVVRWLQVYRLERLLTHCLAS